MWSVKSGAYIERVPDAVEEGLALLQRVEHEHVDSHEHGHHEQQLQHNALLSQPAHMSASLTMLG